MELTGHLDLVTLLKNKPLSVITYTLLLVVGIPFTPSVFPHNTHNDLGICRTNNFDLKIGLGLKLHDTKPMRTQ